MTNQVLQKSGYEKWQDGLVAASKDERWSFWDAEVKKSVGEYNRHLSGIARYIPLDWCFIKAMLWVETGANHPQWRIKPMQIGVPGDPGLTSLLSDKEGGDLILPPTLKGRLTMGTVKMIPEYNIRAGIGYLLMRMANFEYRTILDVDTKIYDVTIKQGDSFEKIAKAQRSTVDILRMLNPKSRVLQPGKNLKYQRASSQRVISSWRCLSTTLIAQRYNGGGDPNYAKKLDYALTLIRMGTSFVCVQ